MGSAEDEIRFEAEAGGVAFMLLGAAFHELATAVLKVDPERGHALLDALQRGVTTTLSQFGADRPDLAGNAVMREAERRVRGVMRAAQGLGESEGDE